jgi:tRNA wybutosine-synthesizing protein 3
MENFQDYKKRVLMRSDKSFIGELDEKIQSLCKTINSKESLVTLSSCSGRVCLLELIGEQNKKESRWLYVSHEYTDKELIKEKLSAYKDENKLYLRQESAILHFACSSIELAEKLLNLAREAGFNRAVFLTVKNHIIIELICSQVLSVPVFDKKILIEEEYLTYLCELANKKQEKSWSVINNFEKKIQKL